MYLKLKFKQNKKLPLLPYGTKFGKNILGLLVLEFWEWLSRISQKKIRKPTKNILFELIFIYFGKDFQLLQCLKLIWFYNCTNVPLESSQQIFGVFCEFCFCSLDNLRTKICSYIFIHGGKRSEKLRNKFSTILQGKSRKRLKSELRWRFYAFASFFLIRKKIFIYFGWKHEESKYFV